MTLSSVYCGNTSSLGTFQNCWDYNNVLKKIASLPLTNIAEATFHSVTVSTYSFKIKIKKPFSQAVQTVIEFYLGIRDLLLSAPPPPPPPTPPLPVNIQNSTPTLVEFVSCEICPGCICSFCGKNCSSDLMPHVLFNMYK